MRTLIALLCLMGITLLMWAKPTAETLSDPNIRIQGNGLSCNNVYLSDGKVKITRKTFAYGERFYVNFEHVQGFIKEDSSVFIGMDLYVLDVETRDTVISAADVYGKYESGVVLDPVTFNAHLVSAKPLSSGRKYEFLIWVWDKKGPGTLQAQMEFDIKADPSLVVENQGFEYDEAYLFSKKNAVTDQSISYDEKVYLLIEGLRGLKEVNGKVGLGLSLQVWDSEGKFILDEKDLFANQKYDAKLVEDQVAPHFIIYKREVSNPVTCRVVAWDKNDDKQLSISARMFIR